MIFFKKARQIIFGVGLIFWLYVLYYKYLKKKNQARSIQTSDTERGLHEGFFQFQGGGGKECTFRPLIIRKSEKFQETL